MPDFPFYRKGIDDTAKAAVETMLLTKFPEQADFHGILQGVDHENVSAWIVRVMNASTFEDIAGIRDAPAKP